MNIFSKNEHLIQTLAFAFVFFLVAYPALASEINETNVLDLVNGAREEEGAAPLALSSQLSEIAREKLNDMVSKDYFAHTSPAGNSPWYWYEKEGYNYKYAGENLAINFMTAEDQQKAWMDSATHRKNILNPNFQEVGVAVAAGEINGQNAIIAVQEFGTKIGASEVPTTKNFSGFEKKNIVEEGKEMKPRVLSFKAPLLDQTENKFNWNILPNVSQVMNALQLIAAILMTMALVLSPLVFIATAMDHLVKSSYPRHAREGR